MRLVLGRRVAASAHALLRRIIFSHRMVCPEVRDA